MRRKLVCLLALAACSGDDEDDAPFTDQGGSLEVPDCGYTLNTRLGADIPRIAGSKIGNDPTPRLLHLGLASDPRTSMVAQWRTVDEETRAGSIRYGVGADLSPAQLTKTVKGIQFGYSSTGSDIYRVHQAHLCELEPGTKIPRRGERLAAVVKRIPTGYQTFRLVSREMFGLSWIFE